MEWKDGHSHGLRWVTFFWKENHIIFLECFQEHSDGFTLRP